MTGHGYRFVWPFLIALAVPGLAAAEAPDTALRPEARPRTAAAEAPLRPLARPAAAVGVINTPVADATVATASAQADLPSGTAPSAADTATPAPLAIPPTARTSTDITLQQADTSPVVARQAPSLALTLDTPTIAGGCVSRVVEIVLRRPPSGLICA